MPILSRDACMALKIIPENFPQQLLAEISATSGHCSTPTTAEEICEEFSDVFSDRISMMKGDAFSIKLRDDAQPYCCTHVRRIPEPLKEKLEAELANLEAQDIIEKVTEPSNWCAPISVQAKKNGAVRLCVDLRKLNKFVIREPWQSPTPLEVVTSLPQGAKYFTTVDAVKGYHQIPLDEKSRSLTTFVTPFSRYRFKRAPFGISSISEHYNRRVYELISDLKNTHHVVDDVIIADSDLEQHKKNVRAFLLRCREHGVSLNKSKFRYACASVSFAGFKVSENGYSIDDEMLSAIKNFPEPKNRTDL